MPPLPTPTPTTRFCIILRVPSLPDDNEPNNNGYFMIPRSSNKRVGQKVQMTLMRQVSKNITVKRVKYCPPSHWMIFLTFTINERIEQGEEEELEYFTRTGADFYETPNGWRIKKFEPRPSRGPQDYDDYLLNFGIPNGIIIAPSVALSRIPPDDDSDSILSESTDERLDQDRTNEGWTSINPHNRVDITRAVVGILVREVN